MLIIRDRAHLSIGRSFSVRVKKTWSEWPSQYSEWGLGNSYNYGMLPPRYPVPSKILDDQAWRNQDAIDNPNDQQ